MSRVASGPLSWHAVLSHHPRLGPQGFLPRKYPLLLISGLWEPHSSATLFPRAPLLWAAVHASSWPFWLEHDDLPVTLSRLPVTYLLLGPAPAAQVELALGAPPRCFATAGESLTNPHGPPAPDPRSCPHRPKPRAEQARLLGSTKH